MPRCIVAIGLAFCLPLAWAQDFRKIYTLAPGGSITVINPLGNIKITGYSGKEIEVLASRKGPDRENVSIQDNSFGNRIHLFPRYLEFGHGDASVDFNIRVPRTVEYNFSHLKSTSGKLEISGVRGRIWAESVGGSIEVRDVQGLISASSVSGSVYGDLAPDSRRSNLMLASISGNISVHAPTNLDALVHMESSSGLLRTNFPIEVHEARYGSGKSAFGKLGTGTQSVSMRSIFGDVSLEHK